MQRTFSASSVDNTNQSLQQSLSSAEKNNSLSDWYHCTWVLATEPRQVQKWQSLLNTEACSAIVFFKEKLRSGKKQMDNWLIEVHTMIESLRHLYLKQVKMLLGFFF